MIKASYRKKIITAWAGMLAPVLFVAVFTIEGFRRPGYNPMTMFVSALSLGGRGWIQMVNFLVFGALLFVFTRGLKMQIQDAKGSKAGMVLLTIIAICYFISGPFVMDPAGTPQNLASLQGTVHGLAGAIVFLLMPASCFVYLRRFHSDPKWRPMYWWTLVLGIISAVGMIMLTVATKFPSIQNEFSDWLGLIQRIGIVPFMLWVFLFAYEYYRKILPERI